jgi:serine-type D-Ala-D-Ala carboxypeptidase/endopeptidase (penicillin-binding protein 4)
MNGRRRRRGRGPGPWIVLLVAATLPALALWAVYRWSAERSDGDTAAALAVIEPVTAPPSPVLSTAVVGFRRMPTVISRDVNAEGFRTQVDPFLTTLNDRSCGVVAVDGVGVGSRNADDAVIPASIQKVLVAAVALERLGADFRYTTTVGADVAPVDGVVTGNLYLVGGGDPLLSSDWYPTSDLERFPVTSPTSLDALADDVVAAGVTRVTGDVVGDGSRYDDEFYAPGWGVGVAGLEGGPYDALLVNDARVGGEDQRASDPNAAGAREFVRLLRERGVEVAGSATSGVAPPGSVAVAAIDSAPLTEVVAEMLGNSDNNTAELMVKELGYAAAALGTREAGLQVMREQLEAWDIDTAPIVLVDGSGLSPDNRLTCAAVAAVFTRYGAGSPVGQGLPVAGVSGTLSGAFVGHPVAGRMTGKTGTLNNPPFNADPPAVKALAGFLPVEGGGEVQYVLILNGPTISDQREYRPIWDQLADTLHTYPTGPTPAMVGPR